MKIVYIFQNFNRISPNEILLNVILNNLNLYDDIFLISLYKSQEDNYKDTFIKYNIKFIEFENLQEALCSINSLLPIVKTFDILHLNQYKSNEFGNLLQKFNTNLKLISTCHSEEDKEIKFLKLKGNAKIAAIVRLREQSNFYRKHHKVIAVSKGVKSFLKRINCTNSKVIYNGINFESFPSFSKNNNELEINFCQVGHILRLKNQLYSITLIQFLKKHGLKVKLHIFGRDSYDRLYKKELESFIEKNALQNEIVFYGEVSHKILFSHFQKMDIFLMPSLTEGLPLALLEAFYFGLPAIVSNKGGMKEIVKNNFNGILLDLNNKNSFKKILTYCLSNKYLIHGKNAKKEIVKNYNSKIMAKKYYNEYLKLLKN